jgi:hypothetical protein
MNPDLIKRIQQLIGEGKYGKAIDLFDPSCVEEDIIFLKSRIQLLQRNKLKGIISVGEENIETNKIVDSLLQYITESNYSATSNVTGSEKVDIQLIMLVRGKFVESLAFYYVITLLPITLGGFLGGFFYFNNGLDILEGLGSFLIISISGLPIREIINRKDKILFLEILIIKIDSFSNEKINSLLWSIIESTILNSSTNYGQYNTKKRNI